MLIKTHNKKYYFSHSPDEDFPAGNIAAVFNINEKCVEEGLTHGLLSHAVKHLDEFDSIFIADIISVCIKTMKTAPNIYLINKNGQLIEQGIRAKTMLNKEIVLNTLDLVNDKTYENQTINSTEKKLTTHLNKLGKSYLKLIDSFTQKAIDINRIESLEIAAKSENIIKFIGEYKTFSYVYYLCFKTSALCVLDKIEHNCIITLFRIDKNGNDLTKICSYLSSIKIKNPMLLCFIKNVLKESGKK